MLKIFSVMEKFNEFSKQIAGSGLSSDYSKEETKRKGKRKKHLNKLEQKKKRLQIEILQIEIDNIKKKRGSKKVKKKPQKKTITKPEILGFDYQRIGDSMMKQDQQRRKDEV